MSLHQVLGRAGWVTVSSALILAASVTTGRAEPIAAEAGAADAGTTQLSQQQKKLEVVVTGEPPFVDARDSTRPKGLSVAIFREAARILDLDYELREIESVERALAAVNSGSADIAVGPISITADRARTVQFTQPYYQSSLAILAPASDNLLSRIKPFLTRTFMAGLGGLSLVLVLVGTLVWLVERKHNPDHFPAHPLRGIGNGVWLALVTMTTVGYGDRAPISLAGRIVCGVWMLLSMIVASSLTAFVATALTLSQLDAPQLAKASELNGRRVAVVAGTTSETFVRKHRGRVMGSDTLDQAVDRLSEGHCDAVVADRPMLRYWLSRHSDSNLQLSETSYEPQGYGFAVAPNAADLRGRLDHALLKLAAEQQIAKLSDEWLGAP